jgi:HTH-type transcriptional regulator/antitoxin HigA
VWFNGFVSNENTILPPGEFVRQELESRGWTQADLAKIIERPLPTVNEIIQGKRGIMPEMAVALAAAFGTTPDLWMQRESSYRLSLVTQSDPEVQRRARLFEIAPVKDMEKRGWIRPTRTVDELNGELCSFFNVPTLDENLATEAMARQSASADELTAPQRSWIGQATRLASILNARKFNPETFKTTGLKQIRALAESPEKTSHVPKVLAELGIRFLVIQPLPKSLIDGAAFWLDENSPVIVLSLRYDRIDWFWFTLAHELQHIKHGDKRSIDTNLVGETRLAALNDMEERANKEGAAFLLPPENMESFVIRSKPFYHKQMIVQFAKRMGVHPGIVNGQLQHLHEIGWEYNREMLVKVRDFVTATALTDGWGKLTSQFLTTNNTKSN